MSTSDHLLDAVQLAARTLSSTGHIDDLLPKVLQICMTAVGASGGTIYLHDEVSRTLMFRHVLPDSVKDVLQFSNIPDDFGVAGKVYQSRQTEFSQFATHPDADRNKIEAQTGVHVSTMITAPLMLQGDAPIGVVQLINKSKGIFSESDAIVLNTVAAVSTLAYLNHKLAEEMTKASTLLGMGKVSHDIGNLAASLHSNINLAEFALEMIEEKVEGQAEIAKPLGTLNETIDDLSQSVDRIVSYSRLISDLSAGRTVRPDFQVASLAQTISTAASYLATEARSQKIDLVFDVQDGAPDARHDPQFVFRIVQNLVGNALKAVVESAPVERTAESHGVVFVRYRFESDRHVLEVTDSGPGMRKEVIDRILAGNARSMWSKQGGSGWGTRIVLELAASHNAEVEIDSEPGQGSTFRVVFPA